MKVLVVFASLVAVALTAPHAPTITVDKEVASGSPTLRPEPVQTSELPAAASAPTGDVVAAPLEAAESVPQQIVVVPDTAAPAADTGDKVTAASEPIATVEKAPMESGETAAVPVMIAAESAPVPAIVVEAPKAEEIDAIAQAAAAPLPSLAQVVEKPTIVSEAVEASEKIAVPVVDTMEAAESVQVPVVMVPAEVSVPTEEKKDIVEVTKAEVAKEEEVQKVEIKQEEPIALPSELAPAFVEKVTAEVKEDGTPAKEPKPLGV